MKNNEKETAPNPNMGLLKINFIALFQITNLVQCLKLLISNTMNLDIIALGKIVSKNIKDTPGKNMLEI